MYEFSIIASGPDPRAEDFEVRFYNSGCDDATVSFQKGHIILDFAREAGSIDEAIASAIEDVLAAGAQVDRVEPDSLVCLSEIAARAEISRAAVTQYSKGQRGQGFPAPVAKITTPNPLYDWAEVARWFVRQAKLPREAAIEAEVVKEANAAIGAGVLQMRDRLKERARELEAAI